MLRIIALFALSLPFSFAFGATATPQLKASYGSRRLAFEENRGQTDSRVRFVARGNGYSIFITPEKAVVAFSKGKTVSSVSFQIAGASAHAVPGPEEPLESYSNYFIGNNPSKWVRDVPNFGKVRIRGVRDGVDLVYYGSQGQLEYDLNIAPGADASGLGLHLEGAQSLSLDRNGDLLIHTAAGDLREHTPIAWQDVAGERRPVQVSHAVRSRRDVAFKIGKYNRSLPLMIDPVVSYSTYLGGSSSESPAAIAVDSFGNAYVTGFTSSADFPVTSGSFNGNQDAYVAKLNAAGSALIYATYVGGSSLDSATAIALDSSGNAYITGSTYSSDFPIIFSGGSSYVAGQDAYVTKVDSSGILVASRYLVGSNSNGTGVAVDAGANPYIVGSTTSVAFPTTSGSFLPTKPAGSSYTGFVAKLDSTLHVSYGTYLGGTYNDTPAAIALDASGEAYIAGNAGSTNFPITNGVYQTTYGGSGDVFVAKLNAQGSALVYSTFLGGSGVDDASAIAVDSSGNAYVTGYSQSANYPVTNGAFAIVYFTQGFW